MWASDEVFIFVPTPANCSARGAASESALAGPAAAEGTDMVRKRKQVLRKRAVSSRRGITLVGPVKVRSGTIVCPSCDEMTRTHVIVATAVLGTTRRVQGPALVSGIEGLPEPAPGRLALIAPNLVYAGNLLSRTAGLHNHCEHCLYLLSDSDLFETDDSPFLALEVESPSDINLSGSDLLVAQATVRTA